jgi:hypothetical protein
MGKNIWQWKKNYVIAEGNWLTAFTIGAMCFV